MTTRISEFRVDLKPVPGARPRIFRNGGRAYPKSYTQYMKALDKALLAIQGTPTDALVALDMDFVFPPFKTSNAPTVHSDLDNLMKAIMDAMTRSGKFWHDDKQVAFVKASKRFVVPDEAPHTSVKLAEIEPHDLTAMKDQSHVQISSHTARNSCEALLQVQHDHAA